MAGLMDAGPATLHACSLSSEYCTSSASMDHCFGALCYSVLYNFVRETTYDVRDILEDTKDGVTTMATTLGMRTTCYLLLGVTLVGETKIGGQVSVWAIGRVAGVMALSSWVATHPRERQWTWALFSLLSLLPAWHAQARLG
jgi:4-hydroxybenzoate polyprenyltransferase